MWFTARGAGKFRFSVLAHRCEACSSTAEPNSTRLDSILTMSHLCPGSSLDYKEYNVPIKISTVVTLKQPHGVKLHVYGSIAIK